TPAQVPAVLGDPSGLKSAIENVVRNAVAHGGVGKPVEVTLSGTTKEVRIVVRDHGPGVPAEDVERIFEPFFRVDPSRDQAGGQGIGLAITARVMELHGGSATARNCPDGGLEVELVVPVTPPEGPKK